METNKQMRNFVSDISGKTFSMAERVTAKSIRASILAEIKKENPKFSDNGLLSLDELNHYRQMYITNALGKESGSLGVMEKQVMESLNSEETFTKKILDDESNETFTYGEKLADKIADFGGSWKFIIIFISVMVLWILINTFLLIKKPFDPYPFILLNLVLSCLAALQAPVIMMSQNRQEDKDRKRAKNDYLVNLKSELEIRMLHEKIDHLIVDQHEALLEIQQIQIDMMNDILKKVDRNSVENI